MNADRAKKILKLDSNFTPEELKKSYRRLVMLYHPDKCTLPDANEKFNEIQSAYSYLQNGNTNINADEILKNIFKSFSSNIINGIPINKIFNNSRSNQKPNKLYITPKEYFTGTTKSVLLDVGNCNCESLLCNNCAGSGYSMDFNVCTNCMGDGWIKTCNMNCSNKVELNIQIPNNHPQYNDIIKAYNDLYKGDKKELSHPEMTEGIIQVKINRNIYDDDIAPFSVTTEIPQLVAKPKSKFGLVI
jgi:DnaJ-class molecular chaperone